jgi:hypothetical protein
LVAAHRDEVEHGQGESLRSHPRQQPAGLRCYSGTGTVIGSAISAWSEPDGVE